VKACNRTNEAESGDHRGELMIVIVMSDLHGIRRQQPDPDLPHATDIRP